MINRNQVLIQIEDMLGSMGSLVLADALLPILKREGYVVFHPKKGFLLKPIPADGRYTEMLDEASLSLKHE